MLDWNNQVLTDKGPVSLRDMSTKYADKSLKDYYTRNYTAMPKTERRFVSQAAGFWIDIKESFLCMNERGEWTTIKGLYFHGSTEVVFKNYFHGSGLRDSGRRSSEVVVKSDLDQQILFYGNKLTWKPITKVRGIGQEYAVCRHEAIDILEYVGTIKIYTNTQFVSIYLEDSMGVCLEPGVVVLSGSDK